MSHNVNALEKRKPLPAILTPSNSHIQPNCTQFKPNPLANLKSKNLSKKYTIY